MHYKYLFISLYLLCISLISAMLTVCDKRAAQKHKSRISEKTLLFLAVLGGGVIMYLTMMSIGHKTKHKRFMIGIPVIVIVEAVIFTVIYYMVKMYG